MAGTMFVLNVIGKGAEPALFAGLGGAPVFLSPGFAFDLPVEDRTTIEPDAACTMIAVSFV